MSLAKELIYTARVIDGVEALQIGLVNHAVPGTEEAVYEKAVDLAKQILQNVRFLNPINNFFDN